MTRRAPGATGWSARWLEARTNFRSCTRSRASADSRSGRYRGSRDMRTQRPIRIGNAAHTQLQLDVYGEMMDALYQARRGGLRENKRAWAIQCALLEHLKDIWRKPDEGIWEVRGGAKHFTYSKIMAWVAFDRAIKSAGEFGMEGSVEEWKEQRAAIHADVCEHGYDEQRQSFLQVYGEPQLDASLLLIPPWASCRPKIRG